MISLVDAIQAPARQSASLSVTDHRPWPLPESSWSIGQTWEDLLFAHWRTPAEGLRGRLPPGLELDLFQDEAWIGVTAFRLTGLRARGLPPLPFLSSFLELNTRTYVVSGGKPGVWFFSLDASSEPAVLAARHVYRLPYFRAEMRAERSGDSVVYESRRHDPRGAPAAFQTTYRPIGDVLEADAASLAHFLTERYCLYTVHEGRLKRGEIHHEPWPLQPAEAEIARNTMPPSGIELSDDDPLLHFSARQDTVIWPLEDA
ncbi:MAG TPA: DUF2071 domain-containing protein [Gaiellaceae bacterium]|nr:DUF2071 domain-containing protein [Gaiellaceae bacterium]